jgi:hypothetical protein
MRIFTRPREALKQVLQRRKRDCYYFFDASKAIISTKYQNRKRNGSRQGIIINGETIALNCVHYSEFDIKKCFRKQYLQFKKQPVDYNVCTKLKLLNG